MSVKDIILGAAIAASSLSLASASRASGNEHVIDDSAVETPGVCHLEAWVTRLSPRQGLVNLSPACTRKAEPRLELGASLQQAWANGQTDGLLGPALKLNLLPDEKGLGLAIEGSATYGLSAGRLETAGLIVPLTIPVAQRLRLNFNAGWSYSRAAGRRNAAFRGAQAELALGRGVTLMTECFRRDGDRPGGQLGLRWTPGAGPLDLDLVAGRRIDGASSQAVSLGVTVRG